MNPQQSLETLKNRLWVTEYYRNLHGEEFAHWPHYFLRNSFKHINKYKFNYAVKAFFLYHVYRDVQTYRYEERTTFMPTDRQFHHLLQITYISGLTSLAFLLL